MFSLLRLPFPLSLSFTAPLLCFSASSSFGSFSSLPPAFYPDEPVLYIQQGGGAGQRGIPNIPIQTLTLIHLLTVSQLKKITSL